MTRLSVVIPSGDTSRGSNLERLLEDLQSQSRPPDEVEVVRGERPNGHARNVGVSRTTGDVLVFLDDDVRLGTPDILKNLEQTVLPPLHAGWTVRRKSNHFAAYRQVAEELDGAVEVSDRFGNPAADDQYLIQRSFRLQPLEIGFERRGVGDAARGNMRDGYHAFVPQARGSRHRVEVIGSGKERHVDLRSGG